MNTAALLVPVSTFNSPPLKLKVELTVPVPVPVVCPSKIRPTVKTPPSRLKVALTMLVVLATEEPKRRPLRELGPCPQGLYSALHPKGSRWPYSQRYCR